MEKGCNMGAMGGQIVDWRFHRLDPISIDPNKSCAASKKICHLKDKTSLSRKRHFAAAQRHFAAGESQSHGRSRNGQPPGKGPRRRRESGGRAKGVAPAGQEAPPPERHGAAAGQGVL